MKLVIMLLYIGCVLVTPYSYALSFDEQEKFDSLTRSLRCLKCQNQTLADSSSPFAMHLKHELYQKVQQGEALPDILATMVGRYGEFIVYEPAFNLKTSVLWFAPLILLLLGAYILQRAIKWH